MSQLSRKPLQFADRLNTTRAVTQSNARMATKDETRTIARFSDKDTCESGTHLQYRLKSSEKEETFVNFYATSSAHSGISHRLTRVLIDLTTIILACAVLQSLHAKLLYAVHGMRGFILLPWCLCRLRVKQKQC
jgi:Flp pilus assembly protein TadB